MSINIDHKMWDADSVYYKLKESVFDKDKDLFLSGRKK